MAARTVRNLVRAVPDRGELLVCRQRRERACLGQRRRLDALYGIVEDDHGDVVRVRGGAGVGRICVERAGVGLVPVLACRIEGDLHPAPVVGAVRGGQEDGGRDQGPRALEPGAVGVLRVVDEAADVGMPVAIGLPVCDGQSRTGA